MKGDEIRHPTYNSGVPVMLGDVVEIIEEADEIDAPDVVKHRAVSSINWNPGENEPWVFTTDSIDSPHYESVIVYPPDEATIRITKLRFIRRADVVPRDRNIRRTQRAMRKRT